MLNATNKNCNKNGYDMCLLVSLSHKKPENPKGSEKLSMVYISREVPVEETELAFLIIENLQE